MQCGRHSRDGSADTLELLVVPANRPVRPIFTLPRFARSAQPREPGAGSLEPGAGSLDTGREIPETGGRDARSLVTRYGLGEGHVKLAPSPHCKKKFLERELRPSSVLLQHTRGISTTTTVLAHSHSAPGNGKQQQLFFLFFPFSSFLFSSK